MLPIDEMLLLSLKLIRVHNLSCVNMVVIRLNSMRHNVNFKEVRCVNAIILQIRRRDRVTTIAILAPTKIAYNFFPVILIERAVNARRDRQTHQVIKGDRTHGYAYVIKATQHNTSVKVPPRRMLLILLIMSSLQALRGTLCKVGHTVAVLVKINIRMQRSYINLNDIRATIKLNRIMNLIRMNMVNVTLVHRLEFTNRHARHRAGVNPIM